MSSLYDTPWKQTPLFQDPQALHRNWGWVLALGLVSIILGTVALGWSVLATLASVILLGWILLVAGVLEAVHAFWQRKWGGFFLYLLNGILSVVVGLMLVGNPAASAVVLTLLLAMFFMVGGIFRIIASLVMRFPSWGWRLFNGLISLLLGILIWSQWPVSGLWVIGLFVGIDLIFSGWCNVMLALAARRPASPSA
jgi:uncharacterized membrane protein HdeD (DUF308 family)